MSKTKPKQEEQAQAEEQAEITALEAVQASESEAEPTAEGKPAAKAGKRSAKATAETEAEVERRTAAKEAKPAKAVAKKPAPKPNPLKRHGKRYRAALEKVEAGKAYELAEAVKLAQATSTVKFDASVELHINLGVDPRQADQMVRSTVTLPAGTGKSLRVAVLCAADKAAEAKAAGADKVGEDDLLASIEKGQLDFDVLIATPALMPKLAKLAKVLGPKGLMPNPKSGTVTADPAKAVIEAKTGRVEFRIDKQAIIHQAIGKTSFKNEDLLANAKALILAVMQSKPASTKGTYVEAMSLTTSMGPGIRLDVTEAIAASNPRQ